MEGKDLWRFLDLVKEFREKGDEFEKRTKEVDDEKGKLKASASVYKEVANRLYKVLEELNSNKK